MLLLHLSDPISFSGQVSRDGDRSKEPLLTPSMGERAGFDGHFDGFCTLSWLCVSTRFHAHARTHTHRVEILCCSSYLSQPLSLPSFLFLSCYFFIFLPNSSCSSGVSWGPLLWGDSDKIKDATAAANQKLEMLWKAGVQINARPGEVASSQRKGL